MSNPQKIKLVPVQVFPKKADVIIIQAATFGPPPTFNYLVGDVLIEGADAIPAVGVPGHPGYQPEVPAVQQVINPQFQGQVTMTQSQWDNWPNNVTDDDYIRDCVLTNLGYTKKP